MVGHSLLISAGTNQHAADLEMADNCTIWECLHPEAEILDAELGAQKSDSVVVAALFITYWEPEGEP